MGKKAKKKLYFSVEFLVRRVDISSNRDYYIWEYQCRQQDWVFRSEGHFISEHVCEDIDFPKLQQKYC